MTRTTVSAALLATLASAGCLAPQEAPEEPLPPSSRPCPREGRQDPAAARERPALEVCGDPFPHPPTGVVGDEPLRAEEEPLPDGDCLLPAELR